MANKVSDIFVQCLENEGVRYIFGLPGEENEDLLYSLSNSSITFVPTRHEQGAAFMANVWGRLTGKAGVCLSTLGPGATNLMTGVADAFVDKSPVVAITGQADLRATNRESHQYLNVVNLFDPITKWNGAVPHPDATPEIIRKAFKTAEEEKPGSTHIEISEDIAKLKTSTTPIPVVAVRRPSPDMKSIETALEALKNAKKPLVLAGNGAIRKLASKELRRLTSSSKIPVVHTFMGQGAVSDFSDESLLTIGLGFRDYVMEAVDQADLVLAVGYDIAEYEPVNWNPKANKNIIHLDFLPAEVYTHYQPTVEVVADISASLWAINEALEGHQFKFDPKWYAPVRQKIWDDIRSYDLIDDKDFTIPGALNLIREILGDEDILISDVGSHKLWVARNFPVALPNGCLISNGLASMGIALPGAIAAALVHPKKKVVAAMGDGGFLINSQELETAKRLGVDFTVVIFNDNDYGLISWKQLLSHENAVYTKISNPDFKKYTESFGLKGYYPKNLKELKVHLSEAINSKGVNVVEIPVSNKVNLELVQKLKNEVKSDTSIG